MIDEQDNRHPLQIAAENATREYNILNNRRGDERSTRIAAFAKRLDVELAAKYDAAQKAASKAQHAAVTAWEAHQVAEAQAGVGAKYPVGTIMEETAFSRYDYSTNRRRTPTGKRGRIVVATRDMEHPDGWRAYRRAKPGTFIIRHLRKDGSVAKTYTHAHDHDWRPWVPNAETVTQAPDDGVKTP